MAKLPMLFLIPLCLSCGNSSGDSVEAKNVVPDTPKQQQAPVEQSHAKDSLENSEYKERLHRTMERLTDQLSKVGLTGIAEEDLSKLMIIDIFAGMEMCRLHTSSGKHEAFKKLAEAELKYFEEQEEFFHAYQLQNIFAYRPPKRGKKYEIQHISIPAERDIDGVFVAVLGEFNHQTIQLIKTYLPDLTDATLKKKALLLLNHLAEKNNELKALKDT